MGKKIESIKEGHYFSVNNTLMLKIYDTCYEKGNIYLKNVYNLETHLLGSFKEITVNGEKFDNYNDCLNEIKKISFKQGGGDGTGSQSQSVEEVLTQTLNYPFINRGFSKVIEQNEVYYSKSKQISGNGLNHIRDIKKVEIKTGVYEYWVAGMYMTIYRYDSELQKKSEISGLYGNATKTNNLIQFVHDIYIDYQDDKIYFACTNRHVVRVYKFSTIKDGNFVSGKKGTGGHLYDIGIEISNNTHWLHSSSGTNHAGKGYLYHPYALEKNPINGNIIIANELGYAENQTSNEGFIAEYSSEDGSFKRTIFQHNGSNADGGNVDTLNSRPVCMAIKGDNLYVGGNFSHVNICDLKTLKVTARHSNYPNNYDNSNFRLRPTKIVVDTDGKILVCNYQHSTEYDKNGVVKLDKDFNVVRQAGNAKDITDIDNPYRLQQSHCIVNVGDRGLGVGDWYIVGNGASHHLSLISLGKVSDGTHLPNHKTFYESTASLEVSTSDGWKVSDFVGNNSVFDQQSDVIFKPIEALDDEEGLTALIEKI